MSAGNFGRISYFSDNLHIWNLNSSSVSEPRSAQVSMPTAPKAWRAVLPRPGIFIKFLTSSSRDG
jgi:hypothetical protein